MSAEQLSSALLAIVGALLSVVFQYVPAVKRWYEGLENKGLVMLGLVVAVAGVYFALACSPFAASLDIPLECSQSGVFDLLKAVFLIASGNQLAYLFGKK